MSATPLEIYKAQAGVLVPVVKALEKELGEERAHVLIRDAIGNHFRDFGKTWYEEAKDTQEKHFGNQIISLVDMFAEGDAVDYEIEESTEDHLKYKITRCKYADIYKEIGAPELGFLFVCYQDYAFNNAMRDDTVLERTQTIMEGAPHCAFNWYIARDEMQAEEARKEEEARAREMQAKLDEQKKQSQGIPE